MKKQQSGRSPAALRKLLEQKNRALDSLLGILGEGDAAQREVHVGPGELARPRRPVVTVEVRPKPSWLGRSVPKGGMAPPAGWSSFSLDGVEVGVVAILLFDLDSGTLRKAIATVEQQQRQALNFIPVFLTDTTDHGAFRAAGHVFEYFPAAIYGSATDTRAFREKYDFVRRKWNVGSVIDLSRPGYMLKRAETEQPAVAATSVEAKPCKPTRNSPPPRPAPPPIDEAALVAEYQASRLAVEADSFVLYRVIGNDLFPRHRKGQSAENVRFILENERPLPGCEKRFIVNRIVDPVQEAIIIGMLDMTGHAYLRIPFDWAEYRAIHLEFDRFPTPAFFLRQPKGVGPLRMQRAGAQARRRKVNYVMNNNGARNAALRDGRSRAKWVLPWDGNCFLTEAAWAQIVDAVKAKPHLKYFSVPMARMTENTMLLDPGFAPEALDEPQLLFRRDAAEEFDDRFPYGRRPKVELFWRLGIPGDWDKWPDDDWDLPRPGHAAEAGQFGRAGWVARLFSGMSELESATRSSMTVRGMARNEAITATLSHLDAEDFCRKLPPTALTAYDETKLAAMAEASHGTAAAALRESLERAAREAMARPPGSVVDKTSLPPSGDAKDYFHPAPYWWPNPNSADGQPFVRRDGERRPGTRLYEPGSEQYDRTRLQRLFDDTTVLALAWKASGDPAFAEAGAGRVRRWFVDPQNRMNPHLLYAQMHPPGSKSKNIGFGIIEMKDIYYFLDAVRLLEGSGAFGEEDRIAFRQWLTEYLKWLQTSASGKDERLSINNHGTCFDLQTASIGAYLGDHALLVSTHFTSCQRILEQFDADGGQPHELTRTSTAHYCCFNLQSWFNLAALFSRCGVSLWDFRAEDGRGLERASQWLLPRLLDGHWSHPQAEPFDRDRCWPLLHAAAGRYATPGQSQRKVPGWSAVRPLFYPHDGVKPFWMLGYEFPPFEAEDFVAADRRRVVSF